MGNFYFGGQKVCPAVQITDAQPVISSLNITPTTSAQTITAPSGTDGYSPITVSAVTASIDNNIVAENIKSGVSILGVAGNVTQLVGETRSVSITSTSGNTFTPSSGKNGITSITVTPTNQAKTITPTTSSQTITVPSGYSGFGTLTVNAVTSSIDSNITAGNIKSGVSILGVNGSVTELNGTTLSVTPTTSAQSLTPTSPYNGYTSVSVSAVTSSIDANITAGNIKDGVSILGVTGTYTGEEQSLFGITLPMLLCNYSSGVASTPTALPNPVVFTGLKTINSSALDSTFKYNTKIKGASFPDLEKVYTVGMRYMFQSATELTSLSLPKLKTIDNSGCTWLASGASKLVSYIDLSNLETIASSGLSYAFYNTKIAGIKIGVKVLTANTCTSLCEGDSYCTEGIFDNLLYIGLINNNGSNALASAFAANGSSLIKLSFKSLRCIDRNSYGTSQQMRGIVRNQTALTELYFPELFWIRTGSAGLYSTLGYNNYLQSVKFPKLIAGNCPGIFWSDNPALTELHFGKKNQSYVESLSGYSTLFGRGAGAATVYFDLITEITCNNEVYERYAPLDDETNGKYAWVNVEITSSGSTWKRNGLFPVTGQTIAYYPYKWTVEGSSVYKYTDCVNPILDEDLLYTTYASSASSTTIDSKTVKVVYTTNRDTPAIGDDYYTESGGSYSVGGQITTIG